MHIQPRSPAWLLILTVVACTASATVGHDTLHSRHQLLTSRATKGVVNHGYMRDAFQRGLGAFRQANQLDDTFDYTSLVNVLIGTGATSNPGNVFPGASIPFGMAKVGIDVDDYAPAGYNDNEAAAVRGMSLLHDSGTGSSSGSFGNFESLPLVCAHDDFNTCTVTLDDRKRERALGKDVGSPGYFSTTLNNSLTLEATSTRRAALLRYTWPADAFARHNATQPYVVFDWTNDLPGTFRGGRMHIDADKGRMTMNGTYASSFGSPLYSYNAYACYDLLADGAQQIDFYGLWSGDRFGQDTKLAKVTYAQQERNTIGGQPAQRGALISWKRNGSGDAQVLLRAGVSYVSAEQACSNAEEEIPQFNFDAVHDASKALWNDKLRRLQIANDTDETITQLVYSSYYRSFLSPNNATGETQGVFAGTTAPYYDGLYCSWDTFRTFYGLLSLTSPYEFGEIVQTYIDGWRKQGFLPECRANNVPGLTQGGSDGTNIIADFAVKYRNAAAATGVDVDELYAALYSDATTNAAEWNNGGRQIGVYEQYGYLPFGVYDTATVGRQTREGSRTIEYAFNDFAIRDVALLLGKLDDAKRWTKRALSYSNVFDKDTHSMGFSTFVQRRYVNGSFGDVDPIACSPIDTQQRSCSLQQENVWGVYETSSFEYSLSIQWDFAGLIKLLVGNATTTFVKRLDTFFDRHLYYSGNEPSFPTPTAYHYANKPVLSVDRVRNIVYTDFNTTAAGLPGNDDNAAMATWLTFHLLGLYPIPSTREFLITSPFVPSYTLSNTLFGTVTVTARNFDKASLNKNMPSGTRAYVKAVTIDGQPQSSRCKITFDQLFPSAATAAADPQQHVQIVLDMATKDQVPDCGPSADDLPSSMSTGGFDKF